jgi:hypothetical protein
VIASAVVIIIVSRSEAQFAIVDSLAFLQVKDSTASLCFVWPAGNLPSAAAVQRKSGSEGPRVIAPAFIFTIIDSRFEIHLRLLMT